MHESDHQPATTGGEAYASALVLGLGVSGEAAAHLLLGEGTRVTVVDQAATPPLEARAQALRARGAEVRLGVTLPAAGAPYAVAVLSPGLSPLSPWVRAQVPPGVPLIGELELGASRCRCPLLAVTGSNGKSTLVTLCTEALVLAGRRARSGGNLGTPLCALAPLSEALDWIVVEVSSFQLECVSSLRPRVAVLLNLQPNHLDRHGDLATYAATKCRLFARLGAGDTAVVRDTLVPLVAGQVQAPGVAWLTIGLSADADWRYRPGQVCGRAGGGVDLRQTRFDNPILGEAAAAAAAALGACGVAPALVEAALRANRALPHRLTELGAVRGVRFFDDSKATSLAAMAAALQMVDGPIRLIAGGLLKETDLGLVQELLAKKVRAVYGIGKAAALMVKAWSPVVATRNCGDLDAAVRAAWADAGAGETILLSPGCASFDQFRSFEERGERFSRVFEAIRKEAEHEEVGIRC